MKDFSDLIKNLKKDFSTFKTIKIAVLGDSATQLLVKGLKGWGYENNINFQIYEADYDQIDMHVFDNSSNLHQDKFDYIIVFHSAYKLLKKFEKSNYVQKREFALKHIDYIKSLIDSIFVTSKAKIIYFNYTEINDSVYGNFANKTNLSFLYQIRKINVELMHLSQENGNLFICDLAAISAFYGQEYITEAKHYIDSDLVISINALPIVVKNITDIILSIYGQFKKCLILDLDNTVWGGIIGDDGVENIQIGDLGVGKAFSELQLWAKQLKERGVILAVCSKNTEHLAKEPFEKHPEMILRLDDIAIFVANWENKVNNIKYIQNILNIGFDSMVFLDDSPFERNMVREALPLVTVPELPEDPAEYMFYIRTLNLFETASISSEDSDRTRQYQEEAKRTILQNSFTNEGDYLQSLEMEANVASFDSFTIPRVAQLSQRSNQFNLRTIRYTEDEIKAISNSNDYITFSFTLADKFGEYGLISAIILKKLNQYELFIDTWIMSCRVLKRGMENFTLNALLEFAKKNGFIKIIGEYIPTPKNGIVKDHFELLGFTQNKDQWEIETTNNLTKQFYIKQK